MRRVISALAGSALLAASGVAAFPASAVPAVQQQPAGPDAHATWGTLADLAGREWTANRQRHRFIWSDGGRTLTWEVAAADSSSWSAYYIFTRSDAGIEVALAGGRSRGPLSVDADGSAVARVGSLGATTRFVRDGDRFQIIFRPIPVTWRLEPQPNGWTGQTLRQAEAAAEPVTPRAPIVIADATPAPAAPRRGPAAPPARAVAPAPQSPSGPSGSGSGPIVIASAPPPPAAMREAPRSAAPAPAARGAAAGSREAQMQAQVETRRVQAAREAEAERQRQAAIAEQARQAEEARRAQEAANSAAWGEAFGMIGALVGGVAAGAASGGDMTAISAGMAAGSSLAAPNSEITTATNQNFETERARYEAQQAQERELHERTMAAMNDPNNPLTRQQRQAEATRVERAETERADMERRHREEREAEEREALEAQRTVENEADRTRQTEERERADAERREAEARRLETERRQREAEAAEREAERQRQEEARRAEQEARERAEADRRAEEERRRQLRQSRMARNASGGFSTVGLPADARGGGGPGRGEMSVSLDHIAGCAATGATVRYSLSSIMGEPTVAGSFSWQGEDGCSLPASTDAWVKVQSGTAYGWAPLDPAPPEANRGFGYNSTGSPNWGGLLCGFEGGSRAGCMDADSAKRLWAHGQVTEVRIGW